MRGLFLLMLVFLIGCRHRSVPTGEQIIKIIEVGTDSTFKREYLPNPNKSLYVTLTRYFGAEVKTFVYYHDMDKKKVSEIKTYMINSLYGHNFEFYDNGNLKQYSYYVGDGSN